MKLHAAADGGEIGERIGIVDALRQHRLRAQILAKLQQLVEHQLGDTARRLVVAQPRIDVVGAGADADDDGAWWC
jgi:hypothetical protein